MNPEEFRIPMPEEDERSRTVRGIEFLNIQIQRCNDRVAQMEAAKILLESNPQAADYFDILDAGFRG
jgi:hypothetical protein